MSFLSQLMGEPDARLLASGRSACALILDASATSGVVANGTDGDETICLFIVEVRPPGGAPYHATVRQRFPTVRLGDIEPGHTLVAVRLDPRDPAAVAIDWAADLASA